MSETRTVLDAIKSITSNRESGRLEINSSGMYGTLLFNEGKLVDARLESLSGFQAVNAAVSLRDVQFSFDHVPPASHASTITVAERVVLKRFFGIEAAEMEEPSAHTEPEPDWNPAPEQVVPLVEVEEIARPELEETPTVEVARVQSGSPGSDRRFPFVSGRRVAVAACLALLLGVAVGAIALRSKFRAPQQSAAVASAVESQPTAVSQSTVESQPGSVPEIQPAVKHAAKSRSAGSPSVASAPKQNTAPKIDSPSVALTAPRRESDKRKANVQDLSGEWRVINTIEKTAYKTFDKMQVGFRLVINQKGKQFTAKGEKFSENGQTLPAVSRTPIHVKGSIEGDKIVATFVEDGRMRRTNGRFIWRLQSGGDELAGTFVSTAANSSGRSAVTKH